MISIQCCNRIESQPTEFTQLISDQPLRETEVANLLREGRSSKDIARILNITERTVKAHRGSIYRKAEINTGNEFIAMFSGV